MAQESILKPSAIVENIVHKTLRLGGDDAVEIEVAPHTIELGRQIALACRRAGADTRTALYDEDLWLESIRTLPVDWLKESSGLHEAMIDACTATISVASTTDPTKLRVIPPERWAANSLGGQKVSEKSESKKLRSVFLLQALCTPSRAEAYGFNLDKWKSAIDEASSADLSEIASNGRRLSDILTAGSEVDIKAPNGTDLHLTIGGRQVKIDDGIIDEEDVKQGARFATIPTGSTYLTVQEDSAEGTVKFDRALHYKGFLIEGTETAFHQGRLTSFSAEKNFDKMKQDYDAATGDKDKIASLAFGLNPRASYGYVTDGIVSGAISIGIGDNHIEGGKNNSSWGIELTLGTATLNVDGKTVVQNGQLRL